MALTDWLGLVIDNFKQHYGIKQAELHIIKIKSKLFDVGHHNCLREICGCVDVQVN